MSVLSIIEPDKRSTLPLAVGGDHPEIDPVLRHDKLV